MAEYPRNLSTDEQGDLIIIKHYKDPVMILAPKHSILLVRKPRPECKTLSDKEYEKRFNTGKWGRTTSGLVNDFKTSMKIAGYQVVLTESTNFFKKDGRTVNIENIQKDLVTIGK